jgi:branched-chain amino acid transport system substrate-binding protein
MIRSAILAHLLCTSLLFAIAPAVVGAAQDPVALGAIYNLEGYQAELDVPSLQGARLAVAQANAVGGMLQRPVELVVKDGRSNADLVNAAADELLQATPSVAAVFGLSDTDMVMAAAPAVAGAGLVFLTSGATSPKLPSQVPTYLFLACLGDNVQAAAGAEWAYHALTARSALVLYDSTKTYPTLLQGYFRHRFQELGGTIVAVKSYDPNNAADFISDLESADLIFLSAEAASEAAPLIRRLRDAGHDGPILGGDGYDAEAVWAAQPEIRDVYFTTHVYLGDDNPDPQVQTFREAYSKAYGGNEPTAFSALGYDAARLLMTAIEEAGGSRPADVLLGLASIKEYRGVSGSVGYSANGRIPKKSVTVVRVEDGRQALVTSLILESVPAP